jgi:hypothetical protein
VNTVRPDEAARRLAARWLAEQLRACPEGCDHLKTLRDELAWRDDRIAELQREVGAAEADALDVQRECGLSWRNAPRWHRLTPGGSVA